MTQSQVVLNMLKEGPVTRIQAASNGVFELSSRIIDLKNKGYNIETELVPGPNKRKTAIYHLITETETTES